MESFPQENRFGSETSEYLLRKNMPLEYKWKGMPRKYRGGGKGEGGFLTALDRINVCMMQLVVVPQ